MKKLWLVMISACIIGAAGAQTQLDKKAILDKMASGCLNMQECSGEMEIAMEMMGQTMKIPGKFWQKGKQYRMDTVMQQPGMPQPFEQNMLFDEKEVTIYQKAMNMVMKIDLSKLPPEMRDLIKKQQAPFDPAGMSAQITQMFDATDVSEKSRDGKKYYVFEIKDLQKMTQNMPANVKQQTALFKRMMMWVDESTYYPSRIEFYADAEKPGMWMEFKNFSAAPVDPSVFKLDIPKDAKIMDMTDMMRKMYKPAESTVTETGKK